MLTKQQELHHHSPEQVAGYLDDALRIVTEADLPDDLRPVAFVEVLKLLAGKQIQYEQIQLGAVPLADGGRR